MKSLLCNINWLAWSDPKRNNIILKEIRELPDEALPKLVRLISLIKEDFISREAVSERLDERINHQGTRGLLSTSKSNWAHDIIADREDRV